MSSWIGLTAGFDSSGRGRGEEGGPEALASAGLFERLGVNEVRELDASMTDTVRDPRSGIIGYSRVVEVAETIREATRTVYEEGSLPLLLGGDCGCIVGALAAARVRFGDIGACFLDAHLDSYDGRTSPTGELADMDIAIIGGHGDPQLVDLAGARPIVQPGETIVIGYRPAGEEELQGDQPEHELADARIQVIGVEMVRAHGASPVGARAAAQLENSPGRYWLHFDVDCLSRLVMPATTYGNDLGLSYEQVEGLLRALLHSPAVIGVSISDFTPPRDPEGVHARRLVELLARAWIGAVA